VERVIFPLVSKPQYRVANDVILSEATLAPHASAGENLYHGIQDSSVAANAPSE